VKIKLYKAKAIITFVFWIISIIVLRIHSIILLNKITFTKNNF